MGRAAPHKKVRLGQALIIIAHLNMTPRLSGHISIFCLIFFVFQCLLGLHDNGVVKNLQFCPQSLRVSLLLRRFVFSMVEASAKCEWPVMNRKGQWEGYRREVFPFPPSLRASFHRERDVWVRGCLGVKLEFSYIEPGQRTRVLKGTAWSKNMFWADRTVNSRLLYRCVGKRRNRIAFVKIPSLIWMKQNWEFMFLC